MMVYSSNTSDTAPSASKPISPTLYYHHTTEEQCNAHELLCSGQAAGIDHSNQFYCGYSIRNRYRLVSVGARLLIAKVCLWLCVCIDVFDLLPIRRVSGFSPTFVVP